MVPILQHLFSRCAMLYLATHPLVMVLPFSRKSVNLGEINANTAPFFFTSSLVPNPLNGAAHMFVMDPPWSKSLSRKNLRNTPRARFPWWFYMQPRRQWRLTTPGFYNSPFVCQNLTQILHFQEKVFSQVEAPCVLYQRSCQVPEAQVCPPPSVFPSSSAPIGPIDSYTSYPPHHIPANNSCKSPLLHQRPPHDRTPAPSSGRILLFNQRSLQPSKVQAPTWVETPLLNHRVFQPEDQRKQIPSGKTCIQQRRTQKLEPRPIITSNPDA